MNLNLDQAASLRSAARNKECKNGIASKKALCCLAIASGKGGVGKTFITVNMALAFQMMGKKTLIIDADLGLANADILLGIEPKHSLQDSIFKGKSLKEIVIKTPYGVDLLAASSGAREMVSMGETRIKMLVDELLSFAGNYDVLIFDCAAGIDKGVTSFISSVPQAIIIASPQPASLMDAYALTKIIHQENLTTSINIIINMADSIAQGEKIKAALKVITQNHLSRRVNLLGVIPTSSTAKRAICMRKPLLSFNENNLAAQRIKEIARKIIFNHSKGNINTMNTDNIVNELVKIKMR